MSNPDTLFFGHVGRHRRTLFVLIADECHFAAEAGGWQDQIINQHDVWDAPNDNIVVLLCSATPYIAITRDSAVPERYALGGNAATPQIAWVDAVRQHAWLERDGAPDIGQAVTGRVFENGKIRPELLSAGELNVVVWRDRCPEPG